MSELPELSGQVGELRFTLEITRKDTGKVEQVEMIGFIDEEQLKQFQSGNKPQEHPHE